MATPYDNWKLDNGIDDAAEDREVVIDERADALLDQYLADHEHVTEAVEQVIGFSDWTDSLASDMAQVLSASEAAFEAEAIRFFCRLYKRVKADLADEAKAAAEAEREAWEQEQAEIRDFYRRRGAA